MQLFCIDLAAVQNKVLAASNSAFAKASLLCSQPTTLCFRLWWHFSSTQIFWRFRELQRCNIESFSMWMFWLYSRGLTLEQQSWHNGFGTTGMFHALAPRQCNTASFVSKPTAVAARGSCANSTVHRKQEKSEDFNIKLLCVSFAAASCKGRYKEEQRTKPHTRLAALLKRHREDKIWRGGPAVSRFPCDKSSSHISFKCRLIRRSSGRLSTTLAAHLKFNI